MSIKSIQIQNFQSYKSTKLQFDPGVNVIVGSSDSGKSAILRAMLWAIFNRPSGESFKSYWGGDTAIDIELEDKTISREKGKENLYIVSSDNPDEAEIEFKAFGTGIPEEIESLLNISDINIQRQMDAPFLLSSTPGEVGRILNQAVRLDIIDRAQSNIRSTLKQEKNSLLNAQGTMANKQEELEKYKWLQKAEGCVAKLETIAGQILQATSLTIDLSRVIDDINTIDASLEETNQILAYSQEIDRLISLDNDINTQTDVWNGINDINLAIIDDDKKIKSLSKLIKAETQISEIIEIQQGYVKLERKRNSLRNLIEDIIHNDKMKIVAKDNMDKRQKEFEIEMPDICPLCSQETK
jgi:DNA repair ATPase RecN